MSITFCIKILSFLSIFEYVQGVKYKIKLSSNYTIVWEIVDNDYINFSAFVRTTGYIGLGLNTKPNMDGADLIIMGIKDERPYLYEYHGIGHNLVQEEVSHWEIGYGKFFENHNATVTLANFARPLDSKDKDGITIEDKELYLLWSIGEDDDVQKKHLDSGAIRVNFINPNINTPTDRLRFK